MKDTTPYPWRLFLLLLGAALFGAIAVIPYSLELSADFLRRVPLPMPLWLVILLQCVQGAIFFTVAVGIGLLVARKLGLGAPILENWIYQRGQAVSTDGLLGSVIAGAVVGVLVVVIARVVFFPLIPQLAAHGEGAMPLWKRLLACFYGAFDEEILMRLFLLSLVLWLLAKIGRIQNIQDSLLVFWAANVLVAVLFGLAHLPAAKLIMPINSLTLSYIISLNGLAGLLFGYLFFRRGLEFAMIAHFSADVVLHVIAPTVVR